MENKELQEVVDVILQAQIGSDGFYLEDDKTMELIEQMLKGE